jgi:L-aminopeptidase/D-esterase-like protein
MTERHDAGLGGLASLRLGHATDPHARTGCTVLLGPFRAVCDIRGFAAGSRGLDSLSGMHLVPRANALLLTGGSAFGLAAAEGVVAWLEERGIGYDVGVAKVPIVPGAVIFDLRVGQAKRRPDAAMGREACENAGAWPWPEGTVGAGTGATVGKLLGVDGAMAGGFGCSLERSGEHAVLALAVVNALGDVLDEDGRVLAGARDGDGRFVDAAARLREAGSVADFVRVRGGEPGTNTTLVVVATDAPLSRDALQALARMGGAAMARRISPVNTPFDGDIVFALSTAEDARLFEAPELLALGAVADYAVARAIERAVTAGPR